MERAPQYDVSSDRGADRRFGNVSPEPQARRPIEIAMPLDGDWPTLKVRFHQISQLIGSELIPFHIRH